MKANRKFRKGKRSPVTLTQQQANESFTVIVNEIMRVEKVDLDEAKKRAWLIVCSSQDMNPRTSKYDQIVLDGLAQIHSKDHANLPPCNLEYLTATNQKTG